MTAEVNWLVQRICEQRHTILIPLQRASQKVRLQATLGIFGVGKSGAGNGGTSSDATLLPPDGGARQPGGRCAARAAGLPAGPATIPAERRKRTREEVADGPSEAESGSGASRASRSADEGVNALGGAGSAARHIEGAPTPAPLGSPLGSLPERTRNCFSSELSSPPLGAPTAKPSRATKQGVSRGEWGYGRGGLGVGGRVVGAKVEVGVGSRER